MIIIIKMSMGRMYLIQEDKLPKKKLKHPNRSSPPFGKLHRENSRLKALREGRNMSEWAKEWALRQYGFSNDLDDD